MQFEFKVHIGFFANWIAPLLSSKTLIDRELKPGKIYLQIYRVKITCSIVSAMAAYSASVVERVTPFRILENQHTQAPAYVITPPETVLLSVALLA